MNSILKMALVIIVFNTTFISASESYKLNNISWDWIAIFMLIILFLLLLISLLRDIKRNRKKIKEHIVAQKCETKSKLSYINDINNSRIKSTNSIGYLLNDIDSERDKSIKKYYKDILSSNKEEEILLNISNNSKIGDTETFSINNMIDSLKEYGNMELNSKVIDNNNIIGNKEIIGDIVFLLGKLQLNEYNYKNSKISLDLEEDKNRMLISVKRELPMSKDMEKFFKNRLKSFYSKEEKKYHGIYLYLVNMLADRINAMVKINTKKDKFTVEVKVPVDINHNKKLLTQQYKQPENIKKALVISDSKNGNKILNYLKSFNFDTKLESTKDLNKEIHNFMDYGILFMDSRLFEPILTDYIETIKRYSNLKIVALVDKKNSLYPVKLVDEVIDLNNIEDTLLNKLSKIYNNKIIQNRKRNIKEDKDTTTKAVLKKEGRVLIADDDITNLHILSYMIKQYGIDIATDTNGEDALKTLEREKFDLVILDSLMPKLDGYETVRKIRGNSNYNAIPVVVHSSFSTEKSSMDKIFELGFDSYLPKPFNKDDLESLLNRYVPSFIPSPDTTIDSSDYKDDLKEFLAIYGDSDKMLDRYIKENRDAQAYSLLKDLKSIAKKINANKFIESLESIENSLKDKQDIDSSLIYSLSSNLKELKSDIMKRLSA